MKRQKKIKKKSKKKITIITEKIVIKRK